MRLWTCCKQWSVLCVVFWCSTCQAGIITTVHNTGIGKDGLPLADGQIDPHYQLIVNPNGTGLDSRVLFLDRFPAGYWFPNTSTSKWIAPQADYGDLQGDAPNVVFIFRTTFDLSGFDPTSAEVDVAWSTDNDGVDVFLNGVSQGQTTSPISYYLGFSTFTIADGFLPGTNTLDFAVYNGQDGNPPPHTGNPVGLRVELSGTAAAVPEPSTFWLFGIGFIGAFAVRRRRPGVSS